VRNVLRELTGWAGKILLVAACALVGPSSFAADPFPEGSEQLVAELRKVIPDLPVEGVTLTPMAGFYAIDLFGGQTLYGSADGRFLFSGDLYELSAGKGLINIAEARRVVKRRQLIDAEPVENMVVFAPAGETRTHVTVFTDVDCGYCRKLHQEMADINALGIEVRYVGYPRAGLGTPTHAKIVSAWCAKNPNEAITALKSGVTIPSAECENPIAGQYELGQKIGVTGTPAIVTADGRLLPGYMPAATLAEAIGLQ